jgi:hypothetical protein
MRSRTLRNERQRDLERGRLSTYRVSRVQGVWASARPAASDASSVRSMRLVLLGGSPRRWANTLAPSAESRRAFGTGPDDCVSSFAGAWGLDRRDVRLHPRAAACVRWLEERRITASTFAQQAVRNARCRSSQGGFRRRPLVITGSSGSAPPGRERRGADRLARGRAGGALLWGHSPSWVARRVDVSSTSAHSARSVAVL